MVRRAIVLVTAVVLLGGVAGVAAAVGFDRGRGITEPNAHGVITVCYDASSGRPRMVNATARCTRGEKKLTWQQGTPRPTVHTVGAGGQPAYQNNWRTYDAAFGPASFFKDASGVVHLGGLVCNTLSSSVSTCDNESVIDTGAVFVLPKGFRPSSEQVLTTLNDGSGNYLQTRIDILPDGEVLPIASPWIGTTWLTLDGLAFHAG